MNIINDGKEFSLQIENPYERKNGNKSQKPVEKKAISKSYETHKKKKTILRVFMSYECVQFPQKS